jgi:hypothetical protein
LPTPDRHSQRGQVLALFALSLTALILGTAVVVDGGFAFAQRRGTQNAADFAAMAGTRIVGMAKIGKAGGTAAANVRAAITETLESNDAELVSAQYVDLDGSGVGDVFTLGSIPGDAFGVVVEARSDWQPFLLGVIGVTDWAASARATARTAGERAGGGLLPIGVKDTAFRNLATCPVEAVADCANNLSPGSNRLTADRHNTPGGFGWLTFGTSGGPASGKKCVNPQSLGMEPSDCGQGMPDLQRQIDQVDVFGCCDPVGDPDSSDLISSFTGNGRIDLSAYIGPPSVPVWVPIHNSADGGGANGEYRIVGFGAIVLTGADEQHARWLEGAAVRGACPDHLKFEDPDIPYCKGPGGSFTFGANGAVQLVN